MPFIHFINRVASIVSGRLGHELGAPEHTQSPWSKWKQSLPVSKMRLGSGITLVAEAGLHVKQRGVMQWFGKHVSFLRNVGSPLSYEETPPHGFLPYRHCSVFL